MENQLAVRLAREADTGGERTIGRPALCLTAYCKSLTVWRLTRGLDKTRHLNRGCN
jgi:hypothetical protein